MEPQSLHRLPGGSIDYDFYRRRAADIRADSFSSLISGRAAPALALATIILVLILMFTGRAPAGEAAAPHSSDRATDRAVVLPGTEYQLDLGSSSGSEMSSLRRDRVLKAIAGWLAYEFDRRPLKTLPEVAFVSPQRMAGLRFRDVPSDHSGGEGSEVLAVYDDEARTIYLPNGWTGRTPAELSVLVHEMVHHLQNEAEEKFDCPEAREKQAYEAQQKWLMLFGSDLTVAFEMDPMTVLVRTNCFY